MSDDIKNVIKKEKSRLKPAKAEAEEAHLRRLRQMERLINRGTEKEVIDAMRSAGIPDGSPEALKVLKIWRSETRS